MNLRKTRSWKKEIVERYVEKDLGLSVGILGVLILDYHYIMILSIHLIDFWNLNTLKTKELPSRPILILRIF